jgi:hypothetical protein
VRRALVVLLVVAGLAVAGDLGFRFWAESAVAARIDEAADLPQRPNVDLHGFPFTLQVIRGRFDRVDVEMDGIEASGLALESVRLELRDVRFPGDLLFGRGPGTIRAGAGTGVVELTDDAVTSYLRQRDLPIRVEFAGPAVRATGSVSVFGGQVSASASGTLAVSNGALVFRPQEVEVAEAVEVPIGLLSFELPLPQPVEGVMFDRVEIDGGVARVEGDLDRVVFRLEG